MKAVVVGLGQFGYAAAQALARAGVETIAFDVDMKPVERIKDEVAFAVCTDASTLENLEAHGVADADLLIAAIGEDFEAQVLVVVNAKKLGVERVVARGVSMDHVRVLQAIGADEVVNPEYEAARTVVHRMLLPPSGVMRRITEEIHVLELAAPKRFFGRTLHDRRDAVLRRHGVVLFALDRPEGEEEGLHLEGSTEIAEGDVLYLAGHEPDLARWAQGMREV